MKTKIQEPHGRETYATNFGSGLVMKRPLPEFTQIQKDKWLEKQHRTKQVVDEILSVNHTAYYNIPKMIFIKDEEYQLLEERVIGTELNYALYQTLNMRQKNEIINSLAHFLVDMNELAFRPIQPEIVHKISAELKITRLENFIENKMPKWFDLGEIKYMADLFEDLSNFEYVTCKAWSHCDLNSGNVLYDVETNRLSFIDFAEADYNFIYRDIFSPLSVDLNICRPVYTEYMKLHDENKYRMPSSRDAELQNIMRYRRIVVLLKRFIKASDDLRLNPQSKKTEENNVNKVKFMRELMAKMRYIEKGLTR